MGDPGHLGGDDQAVPEGQAGQRGGAGNIKGPASPVGSALNGCPQGTPRRDSNGHKEKRRGLLWALTGGGGGGREQCDVLGGLLLPWGCGQLVVLLAPFVGDEEPDGTALGESTVTRGCWARMWPSHGPQVQWGPSPVVQALRAPPSL